MNARELALLVVRDVFPREGKARGAHEAFDYRSRRSKLDERDRAFAAELAYGSIKARRFLDWVLEPYVGNRGDLPPTIREILRLGAHQLTAMGVEPRAAVSESVALAKKHGHRGTAGLVNAVLRRVAEHRERTPQPADFSSEDDYLGTVHSFPTWIVASLRRTLGDGALPDGLRGLNEQAQIALRVNPSRATVDAVLSILHERGIAARRSDLVRETIVVDEGRAGGWLRDADLRWEPQGEMAAVPVDVLDPHDGDRVVELCSGRGNKTIQIAGRIGDGGIVETIEIDAAKVAVERKRLDALGIANVATIEGDATRVEGEPNAARVLLDAPCSGLGILGRQPEARWRKAPGDAAALAPLQGALLEAAARRVAPGGRLVYSVCTTDPREGADRIGEFLAAHGDFHRARAPERYDAWRTPQGDLLFPPGIDRRDGFFIAVVERAAA